MDTEQGWDIVSGVGTTALMVAAARAVESSRGGRLFDDPYAAAFVEAADYASPMPTRADDPLLEGEGGIWPDTAAYVAVRTAAFDDFFRRAAAAGVTQTVLLAAGLDTRAFRLPWAPETVVYEIDQPRVLDFKLGVLRERGARARCTHRPVAADLREDWPAALGAAGFDRTRPTAWLAEGLTPYLSPEAEERLFDEVHRLSAPGSRLAVEQVRDVGDMMTEPWTRQAEEMGVDITSLVHTRQRPSTAEGLRRRGWRTRLVTPKEAAAGYGRELDTALFTDRHVAHAFAELPR